jgi:hypothetical protein
MVPNLFSQKPFIFKNSGSNHWIGFIICGKILIKYSAVYIEMIKGTMITKVQKNKKQFNLCQNDKGIITVSLFDNKLN